LRADVVIGTDPSTTLRAGSEALEKRRQAFVGEQCSKADYELCEVEILPSEQTANLVSGQGRGPVFWPLTSALSLYESFSSCLCYR
jgi:hypothetical protein